MFYFMLQKCKGVTMIFEEVWVSFILIAYNLTRYEHSAMFALELNWGAGK